MNLAPRAVVGVLAIALIAADAPHTDNPDWPCQQRLVPKLAAAAYWNGPALEGIDDWRADPSVADLVRRLAPRKVSTQQGLSEIAAFAQSLPEDRPRRLALEIGR